VPSARQAESEDRRMLDLPRTMNLVGWSRGAITCFMIAHALRNNARTKRSSCRSG
jgi:hypothetical protein